MKLYIVVIAKAVVYLMGLAVLLVCGILLPEIAREETARHAGNEPLVYPFLIGAWVLAMPVFVALYHTLKLLSYIEESKAFSQHSVKALQNIKRCAVLLSILIVLGAVTVIGWARSVEPSEDVTHVITLGFLFTFASSVVATFAAVLQRLLQEAIVIKTENDQTV